MFFSSDFAVYTRDDIRCFCQWDGETLVEAWTRMKGMLEDCYNHGLGKGDIMRIFFHGLDNPSSERLNSMGNQYFMYNSPNQAWQILEDIVFQDRVWIQREDCYTRSSEEYYSREEYPPRTPEPAPLTNLERMMADYIARQEESIDWVNDQLQDGKQLVDSYEQDKALSTQYECNFANSDVSSFVSSDLLVQVDQRIRVRLVIEDEEDEDEEVEMSVVIASPIIDPVPQPEVEVCVPKIPYPQPLREEMPEVPSAKVLGKKRKATEDLVVCMNAGRENTAEEVVHETPKIKCVGEVVAEKKVKVDFLSDPPRIERRDPVLEKIEYGEMIFYSKCVGNVGTEQMKRDEFHARHFDFLDPGAVDREDYEGARRFGLSKSNAFVRWTQAEDGPSNPPPPDDIICFRPACLVC